VDGYQDHLVLFAESKKCKIYRPDAFLFLRLKFARASENDLSDCMAFLKYDDEEARALKKELIRLIKTAIKTSPADKQRKLLEIENLLR